MMSPTNDLDRDLFQYTACPVCRGNDRTIAYPIDKVSAGVLSGVDLSQIDIGVAVCGVCGHQFIQPTPQPAFLKAFYESYMSWAKDGFYRERSREEIPASFREHYGGWLKRVHAINGGGSLLDVGTGLGMFLRRAREHGFEVAGVEPNGEAVKFIQEHYGINVHNCLLEELDASHAYDVVTMWDLLEHLADPHTAIRSIHGMLRPGGLVALETPARDSFIHWLVKGAYRASGGRVRKPLFRVYGLHHLQYFSEESMRNFLAHNGFEIVEIQRDQTDVAALLLRPGKASPAKILAFNTCIKGAFFMARVTRKQNKLMVLARRVEGGVG